MDKPNNYGFDISCNLSSLDIANAVKVDSFEKLVDTSHRLLTQVSDLTDIVNVPSVSKANKAMHSVGLGLMNLHGHLARNLVMYESDDAISFVDYFMEAMNYFSIKSSMNIAKERNETFYGFEKSDYATGEYFDQYVNKENTKPNETVSKLLGNVPVITSDMWKELKLEVMNYGLYNAYRLAIAP